MKFILSILLSAFCLVSTGQTFVSTTPENKNVILEEFTGIYCTFCPDGHLIAQNLHDANPNDVFLINIHTGGYSNPNSLSDPDFNCPYGAAIAANSGLAGYPAGTINRATFTGITPQGGSGTTALSRTDWAAASADIMSQSSYVNVAAQASYDMSTGILTVNTETYYTSTTTNINVLHVAVVQNNVAGPQTGAQSFNPNAIISGPWSPTYNHQHMFRHLMDGANGLEYNVTTAGTFVPNTHTWQMPTNLSSGQSTNGFFPNLDPTNLDVVVYIAEGAGEIITGFQANVAPIFPNAYDANVTNSTAENVVCASQTDIAITFRNYGNQNLTSLDLTYDINGSTYPATNWTGNLASGDEETLTLNGVTFTPQANNTVTWVASNPNGQVDQNTTNNSSTSTFTHFDLNGDVVNNISAGIINVDIFTDGYGSETTWEVSSNSAFPTFRLYEGGPYPNIEGGNTYKDTLCFYDSCFKFTLYDTFNDGFNGGFGDGYLYLKSDSGDTVIYENNFTSGQKTYTFCIEDTSTIIIDKKKDNAQFKLYPNPIRKGQVLNWTRKGYESQVMDIQIHNLQGEIVLKYKQVKEILIPNYLSQGMYILKAKADYQDEWLTKEKLIIY